MIQRLLAFFSRGMLYLATAALLLLTVLVVLSAIMRYVLDTPFAFTEELVGLLFMASIFLALPFVTLRRTHVTISVLPQRVIDLLHHPLRIVAFMVTIAFATWFSVVAYQFAAESHAFGSKTEQSEILLWPWMAIMPAGMALVALISIFQLIGGNADDSVEDEAAKGDSL